MKMKILDAMKAGHPLPGYSAEWHFFRAYVEAALWSSNDESDESGGEPLDRNYDIDDISPDTLDRMAKDCAAFYARNRRHIHCEGAPLSNDDLNTAAREAMMAGHDFWLTRCGHGAGFLDGDWPEPAASAMTGQCGFRKKFGNVDLCVGDDGKIHA